MTFRRGRLLGTLGVTSVLVATASPAMACPPGWGPNAVLEAHQPSFVTLASEILFPGSTATAGAPPVRVCVGDPVEATTQEHGVKGAYFNDVLENPSCAGVPMERMAAKKCVDGQAGMFPCSKVNLAAFIPLSEMQATWANDIWGWTDKKTGREYALVGLGDGTGFVDITKPRHPKYLGKLPTHTDFSIWRDIEVVNNHAFVVSEANGHGLQVFDLERLRGVTSPKTFGEDAWLGGFGQAHTVTADDNSDVIHVNGARDAVTACAGAGNGGPIMVDVSKPTSPKVVGCNLQDGYTHDMQCVTYHGPDIEHEGREICLGSNEDTLTITDVTNKDNPRELSRTSYDTASYVHQGWFSPNQRYFLSNDELDEAYGEVPSTATYMWDLSDLDAPEVMGDFLHGTESIDHQLFLRDGFAFESNYMSGVRILGTKKLSEGDLTKRGFFDVYPSDDAVDFAGTWANYPFFRSGTVVATGIEEGLFVLRPTGKIGNALRS